MYGKNPDEAYKNGDIAIGIDERFTIEQLSENSYEIICEEYGLQPLHNSRKAGAGETKAAPGASEHG